MTQGYISKIKQKEQLFADYEEHFNVVKTQDGDYIWKCWDLYERKSEISLFLDVESSFLLQQLHSSDVLHFIYWFYTLGELVRYPSFIRSCILIILLVDYLLNNTFISKILLIFLENIFFAFLHIPFFISYML